MELTAKFLTYVKQAALVAVFLPAAVSAQVSQPVRAIADVMTENRQPGSRPVPPGSVEIGQAKSLLNTSQGSTFVGAVQIDGRKLIPLEAYAATIEGAIGRELDEQALAKLAQSVADVARSRGLIFASAMVPAQRMRAGVVHVRLDEGAIDEIRISGSKNRRLRSVLDKLKCRAARKQDVERQLLLASDVPGISVRKTSYVREGNKGVLVVEVEELPDSGYLSIDNQGWKSSGPVRARLSYNVSGFLSDDDVLYAQVLNSAAQPRELAYGYARYAKTLNDKGTQASVYMSAGRTQPGARLARFDLTGRSWQIGGGITHPFLRTARANLWGSLDAGTLTVEERRRGSLIQRDRVTTLNIGLNGSVKFARSWLYGGVSVTQGVGAFHATGRADPLASRSDASGRFTRLQAWLNTIVDVADELSLRVAAQGQLATAPLLAAQELGIGGPFYGRGYNFSERTGDRGALGLFEVRRHFRFADKSRWLQIYAFADGGTVDNLRDGFGGGGLASTGVGARGGIGKFEIGIEGAFPLTEVRLDSGNRSPKLNLTFGMRI